ncbi:glycosyl hydrolase family 28-related protein [Pacificimonas sp. ICDLI1SI03]
MTVAAGPSSYDYLVAGTGPYVAPVHDDPVNIAVFALENGIEVAEIGGFALTAQGVVFGAAPDIDYIRVRRRTPRAQTASYTPGGAFPADTHEAALDRMMLVNQEQDDDIADIGALLSATSARALLAPVGETLSLLPIQSARAGRFAGFDAAGNMIGLTGAASAPGALALIDAAAPTGAQLIGYHGRRVSDRLADFPVPQDYGARGNGVTDDTLAMQAFVDAAETGVTNELYEGGARLSIPRGRYPVSDPIVPKKRGMEIVGSGRGTVLFCTEDFPDHRAIIQSRATSDRGTGYTSNLIVRDLALFATDPASESFAAPYSSNRRGIWATGLDGSNGPCAFENLYMRGFGIGIALASAFRVAINYVSIQGGRNGNLIGTGLSLGDPQIVDAEAYNAWQCNAVSLLHNRFQYLAEAMNWDTGLGGTVFQNTIESCSSATGIVKLGGIEGVMFAGTYSEANVGPLFRLGTASVPKKVQGCEFVANFHASRSGTDLGNCDYLVQNVDNVRIDFNRHRDGGAGYSLLTPSTGMLCTNSEIRHQSIFENTAIDRESNVVAAYGARPTSLATPNRYTRLTLGADVSLSAVHAGRMFDHSSASAHNITVSTGNDFPTGGTFRVVNSGSANVVIARDGIQLLLLDGSSSTDKSVAIAPGGHAEIWKRSSSVYVIHGAGLS